MEWGSIEFSRTVPGTLRLFGQMVVFLYGVGEWALVIAQYFVLYHSD